MMRNIDILIKELSKLPKEVGWVEFKHNNCEPTMVGEDVSALANSATLNDRDYAYMIWGVDDETHEIVGTKVRLQLEKKGEQELENWLRYLLSKNADFEFYETEIDGKHVELIRIHKALNEPVAFQKIDYIRSGSYTKKLHEFPVLRAQLWDKLRHAQFLRAPRIEVFQDSTKVTLFSGMEFSNIPMEDKLWSCYLHACLMYIQGDALTNKSLRDRFGIPETSSSSSSRLIKETINKGLIKILDPNTAPRYMKYIPIWA